MKKLYNADHQPAIVDHGHTAVMPGESHNFTDEQVEAGIAGNWVEDNPRKSQDRGKRTSRPTVQSADTEPAGSPEEGE